MLITGLPMVGSLLLYWALIRFIIPPGEAPPGRDTSLIRIILYSVAAGGIVALLAMKRIILAKMPQDNLATLIAKLKKSMMVSLALCEAPTLYGVLLYFIQGNRQDFYILAAYSLLLFAIFFPRLSHWQEYTAGAVE